MQAGYKIGNQLFHFAKHYAYANRPCIFSTPPILPMPRAACLPSPALVRVPADSGPRRCHCPEHLYRLCRPDKHARQPNWSQCRAHRDGLRRGQRDRRDAAGRVRRRFGRLRRGDCSNSPVVGPVPGPTRTTRFDRFSREQPRRACWRESIQAAEHADAPGCRISRNHFSRRLDRCRYHQQFIRERRKRRLDLE